MEDKLRDLLATGHADATTVRALLTEAGAIPSALRASVWPILLGCQDKPDPPSLSSEASESSQGSSQAQEHETALQADCRVAYGVMCGEESLDDAVKEMQSIIKLLCGTKDIKYESSTGLADLLAPFYLLDMTAGQRFNCLYAVVSKYHPRDVTQQSAIHDVFRLLLMYHDPELCMYLDSRRIHPSSYTATWFRALFSGLCTKEALLAFLDMHFLQGDPFVLLFVSLVIVINAKELVVSLGDDVKAIVGLLASMPKELTPEDVPDLVELAGHYLQQTPASFIEEYTQACFGTGGAIKEDPSALLCVHVPAWSLLPSAASSDSRSVHQFFVVDTRPTFRYDLGHINRAWHLDASLMMSSPETFEKDMSRMLQDLGASQKHVCFLGTSGEDDLLHMVVSRVLQHHHLSNVSICRGGFKAVYQLLEGRGLISRHLDGRDPTNASALLDTGDQIEPAQVAAAAEPQEPKRSLLSSTLAGLRSPKRGKRAAGNSSSDTDAQGASSQASSQTVSRSTSQQTAGDAASDMSTRDSEDEEGHDVESAADAAEAPQQPEQQAGSRWLSFKARTADMASRFRQKSAEYSKSLGAKSKRITSSVAASISKAKSSSLYRENEINAKFSIDDDSEGEDDLSASQPMSASRSSAGQDQDQRKSIFGGRARKLLQSAKQLVSEVGHAFEQSDIDSLVDDSQRQALRALAGAVVGRTKKGKLVLDTGVIPTLPAVKRAFQCNLVNDEGFLIPSWLVVTSKDVYKLRDVQVSGPNAVLDWSRPLSSIAKITAKKKQPNILSFVFRVAENQVPSSSKSSQTGSSQASPSQSPGRVQPPSVNKVAEEDAHQDEGVEPDSPTPSSSPAEQQTSTDAGGDGSEAGKEEEPMPDQQQPQQEEQEPDKHAAPSEASQQVEMVEVRERFLIPEADDAKQLLKELVASNH